jgi:type IV pilus assembly protein PilM
MRAALGQLSPRTRSVTVVVPDTVVRVFVLDFDSLPAKAAEAIPILRFRLRKMVPFDVEHAGVSYQILLETKTECKVLAAVLPGPVLAEYEAVVRRAGFEPGAMLPTSLAALGAIDSADPVLIANLSALALTTAITHGQDLLLYRTLDLPEDPAQRLQEVQRGISVAAAYFEDKLGARPRVLYYADESDSQFFADWLDIPDLIVDELAPLHKTGAAETLNNASIAGAIGALAGAM